MLEPYLDTYELILIAYVKNEIVLQFNVTTYVTALRDTVPSPMRSVSPLPDPKITMAY